MHLSNEHELMIYKRLWSNLFNNQIGKEKKMRKETTRAAMAVAATTAAKNRNEMVRRIEQKR